MKKVFVAVLALGCAWLLACSDDADKKTANEIFTAVFDAVDSAADDATDDVWGGSSGSQYSIVPGDPNYSGSSGTIDEQFENGSIHVTGNWSLTDNTYNFNLTISFSNHLTKEGVLINGSATDIYYLSVNPYSMSADLTGEFTVVYEGKTYNFSWDIDFTFDGQHYTLSGGFWLDGQYFPAEFAE